MKKLSIVLIEDFAKDPKQAATPYLPGDAIAGTDGESYSYCLVHCQGQVRSLDAPVLPCPPYLSTQLVKDAWIAQT